jgi:hypothetical protein
MCGAPQQRPLTLPINLVCLFWGGLTLLVAQYGVGYKR